MPAKRYFIHCLLDVLLIYLPIMQCYERTTIVFSFFHSQLVYCCRVHIDEHGLEKTYVHAALLLCLKLSETMPEDIYCWHLAEIIVDN
jgi:hypothetical protein